MASLTCLSPHVPAIQVGSYLPETSDLFLEVEKQGNMTQKNDSPHPNPTPAPLLQLDKSHCIWWAAILSSCPETFGSLSKLQPSGQTTIFSP